MATQRAGKGSSASSEKKNGHVTSSSDSEQSSMKQDRQSKKAQILKEQREKAARLRWALVVILLVVAAIGLYYYISYYQSTEFKKSRTRSTKNPSKSQASSEKAAKDSPKSKDKPKPKEKAKPKEKPKTEKQKKAEPAKKEKKPKTEKQKKAEPAKKATKQQNEGIKKAKTQPPKRDYRSQEEKERVERLERRVLRQPTVGGDPDRPHILDIITGDNLLIDGKYLEALERFNAILSQFPQSPRAQLGKGLTLSKMAEEQKSNKLMDSAIEFFRLAGLESILASETIQESALLALTEFAPTRNKMPLAVKAMEKLVDIRSEEMTYANKLGMLYLANQNKFKAKSQFQKCIKNFEGNHFATAQLGYILYTEKKYDKALPLIMEGIREDQDIRQNGLFYNYAGDALTRLNRTDEAYALYGEAVALDIFPSVWQRSLANERGLEALPWWTVDRTGYMTDIARIEKAMDTIASEALALFDPDKMVFRQATASPHYVLFSKGKKNLKNCQQAPKTCALLETIPEAAGCKRGAVKFSSLPPQTHMSPHVGITNTKLQVLVGLSVDQDGGIQIRVAEENKVLGHRQIGVIDESFEKEVWYFGSTPAVYLTVDMWHPDLSEERRRHLGPL